MIRLMYHRADKRRGCAIFECAGGGFFSCKITRTGRACKVTWHHKLGRAVNRCEEIGMSDLEYWWAVEKIRMMLNFQLLKKNDAASAMICNALWN